MNRSFDVGGGAQPRCITIGSNGQLFVSTNSNDVKVFGEDGNLIRTIGGGPSSNDGNFNLPTGLAFDSQGRLFVGDSGNKLISVFDRNFNFICHFGSFSGKQTHLTIDSFDRPIVSDFGSHQLILFDEHFNEISRFGSEGSDLSQFYYPMGICFDTNQSNLFVCDSWNHRYQKIKFPSE